MYTIVTEVEDKPLIIYEKEEKVFGSDHWKVS